MKSKQPLSLYIHIPFCIQKCLYCDFLSASASDDAKDAYIGALLEELAFWKERIKMQYYVRTIFIGGGTPTCLSPEQLFRLGDALQQFFTFNEEPPMEFTLEANPGTVTKLHIQIMKEIGVDRVSLGLQSAQNAELKRLGRIHTYEDFVGSYGMLRESGFHNINIDLMADIPGQTIGSYQATLGQVLALGPEHISSYSLIVEEGTPFYQMQEDGKLLLPDEDTDREMYELTRRLLEEKGYKRYEISNYAKEGKQCLHNLTYWEMGEYLGIGLGASSYFAGCRFSNVRDMGCYLSRHGDKREGDIHKLSKKEEMEEFAFLGLRKTEGISLPEYKKRFGVDLKEIYCGRLEPLMKKHLLAESGNHDRIYLTNLGIDVSNVVLAEFLLDD
jgi:putative oxygen-independent coproporphyrinogen III oxidase